MSRLLSNFFKFFFFLRPSQILWPRNDLWYDLFPAWTKIQINLLQILARTLLHHLLSDSPHVYPTCWQELEGDSPSQELRTAYGELRLDQLIVNVVFFSVLDTLIHRFWYWSFCKNTGRKKLNTLKTVPFHPSKCYGTRFKINLEISKNVILPSTSLPDFFFWRLREYKGVQEKHVTQYLRQTVSQTASQPDRLTSCKRRISPIPQSG